jgi:1-phosphofructokinase
MYPAIVTLTLNPAIDRTVTIPGFAVGAVNRVESAVERAGGKGINVAAALAAHGQTVAALGFLGRDNAEVFARFLAERGIEDRCLRLPGATRVGIKIFDALRCETTELNFAGLTPAVDDLGKLRGQLAELTGGWCVLAGSLPPGVEAGFYAEAIAALRAQGVRTLLDTSGVALREGLRGRPEVIKPNQHELEVLVGRKLASEAAVIEAARVLVAEGVRLVVVSRGAAGACFVTAAQVVIARPPAVTVGSTVGAGDALVAGVIAGQLRGDSLAETARRGTAYALAALTCGAGATTDALRNAVQAFAPQVQIERV